MLPDAPCNFYPRHKGHLVVNNGNVRPFFNSPSDRLVAIACLGNDLPAGPPFQHGTQSRSHRLMIVSYEDPFHDRTTLQCRTASSIVGSLYSSPKLPLIYLNAIVQRISGGRDGFDAVLAVGLSWAAWSAELRRTTLYLGAPLLVRNGSRVYRPAAAIWLS